MPADLSFAYAFGLPLNRLAILLDISQSCKLLTINQRKLNSRLVKMTKRTKAIGE